MSILQTASSFSPRSTWLAASDGGPSTGELWWQFLFYFVMVILVVFLSWFVTRLIATRSMAAPQSRYMNVLDRLQLAPNRVIYLVAVAGRVLLIGQGDREMSTLAEMSEEELLQYLEANPLPEYDGRGLTFLRNLQEALAKVRR